MALISLATALAIALSGLSQLRRVSDAEAELRARTLTATLAARIRATAVDDRAAVLRRAESVTGMHLMLVDQSGEAVYDGGARLDRDVVVALLVRSAGIDDGGARGRSYFAASPLTRPLEHLSVLGFAPAPDTPPSALGLSNAIAVLTLLLSGVAVAVVITFMRAVRSDVGYVARRIAGMAAEPQPPAAPGAGPRGADGATTAMAPASFDGIRSTGGSSSAAGEPIPIRALDEVGLLTAAFNLMVTRFAAAERSYRADLRHAAEIEVERSEFLAGLSHELRTPLNAILGFSHVLETEAEGPLGADAKEALAQIRLSGEHLRTLIDDILDLSAMETGQVVLSRTDVDVLALAEQVVREARATMRPGRVALHLRGDAAARAWADPRRLRQVLTNLVSNALKFTPEGEVAVSVARAPGEVVLSVTDSGSGIAHSELANIFEAYQQAGDPAERRKGAGLGLAITRRLVLLHDGQIGVTSEPGRGSTFAVRIPERPVRLASPGDSLPPAAADEDAREADEARDDTDRRSG
ncbi:MAG: HAMP domain-containing histidine kinase [Myxococcales bacterium]|nr:HAMP domain-containing histidine kinase [Myxococcales bacterium]